MHRGCQRGIPEERTRSSALSRVVRGGASGLEVLAMTRTPLSSHNLPGGYAALPASMPESRERNDQHPLGFGRRLTIWLLAWVSALIGAGLAIGDPLAIDLAPWFPLGLFFFTGATAGAAARWLVAAGWVLYVGVAAVVLLAKGRRTYRAALVAFCILLALNIVGCYKVTIG